MNPAEFLQLEAHEEQLWWFRGMRRIVDTILDRYCPAAPGARVLEAGCGTGHDAKRFTLSRGWEVTPVDLSPIAAKRVLGRGLQPAVADVGALPFGDGVFEGLISLDALVHLDESGQCGAIAEFGRVLAEGGWMLLRIAALEILRSRHSEWTDERRRVNLPWLESEARRAGLEVRYSTYANSLLLPVALAKFRIWEPLTRARVASGVETPPEWLNRLLEMPLSVENAWLRAGGRLPVGQSVYLVAEKPA
jgi:SAM-dependent methyltransferase